MKKLLISMLILMVASVVSVSAADYFAVWQDTSGDGNRDTIVGYIQPYDNGMDAISAYDYYSASSHMINPTPEAYKSKIWLYDNNGLNLGMFHDVDGKEGSPNNRVNWDIKVKGTKHELVLSDDKGELKQVAPKLYHGRWHYWHNTDGGIIALDNSAPDNGWIVKITPKQFGDVKEWTVHSANGEEFVLDMKSPVWITNKRIPDEVPEFGVIGATLALLGAGFVAYRKRK